MDVSSLYGDHELFPFDTTYDKDYSKELQLQEALLSSLLIASSSSARRPRTKGKKIAGDTTPSPNPSSGKGSFCRICGDPKPPNEMFRASGCTHTFCNDCLGLHIAARLREDIAAVRCPVDGCGEVLEPPLCQGLVPEEVFRRWGDALCESLVLAAPGLNCPYKDCGVFMVDDGGEVAREARCPSCRRPVCAPCLVPSHEGVESEEQGDADQVATEWLDRRDRSKNGRGRKTGKKDRHCTIRELCATIL